MVKKLFKHEFLSYMRIMGLVYIILLTVAAACRIIYCFENDSTAYEIISGISTVTYFVTVFVAAAFAFALAIIRFYKNLFSSEGYLTFTLPITPAQHILVKAVTAVSVILITLVAILLSFCIVAAGQLLSQVFIAFSQLFTKMDSWDIFHFILMLFELLIAFLLSLCASIMLYYTFISIGQLFKKNRILAAVGAYFAYYILTQILTTVFLVLLAVSAASSAFRQLLLSITDFFVEHPYAASHCLIWIAILMISLFLLVEFFVIQKIITKKLNLE